MKRIKAWLLAFAAALGLLAQPVQAGTWVQFAITHNTSNAGDWGTLTLNYLGDLTWTVPGGRLINFTNQLSPYRCANTGTFLVRHDYGGAKFFTMLNSLMQKGVALNSVFNVYVYVDNTSAATACDGGTSAGPYSFTAMQVF